MTRYISFTWLQHTTVCNCEVFLLSFVVLAQGCAEANSKLLGLSTFFKVWFNFILRSDVRARVYYID